MSSITTLFNRYPQLTQCAESIDAAIKILIRCFENGGRLFICGNGGSAADALHIAGELVKSFVLKRPLDSSFANNIDNCDLLQNLQGALPAFALVENTALATAFANDGESAFVFAQQVYTYAREGDCVLGISTSGDSKNIVYALETAKGRDAVTIGLTGQNGGKMRKICDTCICVPENETYKVQELHLPVYHAICLALEEHFWGKS